MTACRSDEAERKLVFMCLKIKDTRDHVQAQDSSVDGINAVSVHRPRGMRPISNHRRAKPRGIYDAPQRACCYCYGTCVETFFLDAVPLYHRLSIQALVKQ